MDQPPTVAFTVFTDAWPRAIETEIGTALCTIWRVKDFFDMVIETCVIFDYHICIFKKIWAWLHIGHT